MAILRKSIEPSVRIKHRDYTIPIRLNQRLPPSVHSNLSQVTAAAAASSGARRDDVFNLKLMKHRTQRSQLIKVKKMIHPISMKATKRFLPSFVLVVVACATLTISNTQICHCDTKTSLHSTPAASKSRPSSSSSSSHADYSTTNLSQKESLLTALSDNIERQHFKIKPARPLIQQRPSKFDGEDYLAELNLDAGIDFIKKKAQPLVSMKKVDESMRQILRMHESAHTTSGHNGDQQQGATGLQNKPSSASIAAHIGQQQLEPTKRWRKIAQSPVLVNSLDPNKVVSKVLAYVTPLVSSKLADSTILGQSFMMKNLTTTNGGSSRLRLHPFVARSNNQASSLSKNLLSYRPYATASPVTSSLVRPEYNKYGNNRHQYSTPPSTLMNNNYKAPIDIKTSGSPSSVDSIISDLMADSSDNSIGASIEAVSAGISSQLGSLADESNKKPADTTKTNTGVSVATTSVSKPPQKSAGSLLKKGANHLAQNYFQNSFRDLITLSQLPILSTTSSTSTAPSVLEKKRKPNKVDKAGSKFRRRRLIEDLYRYAYMLRTGVRNKRDPLEALGSSPSPLISSSAFSQKSVLSQRSINQLMASNHNQMLNYVRKLRSMLTVGPLNKAKPRGVMWDMATDPSLAVTVFHLLERASVALPLGFLLLPVVQMIRHPLNGLNLGRILPARASHRSVDIEELAKRLDIVDKMLSRALRSTHRESFMGK